MKKVALLILFVGLVALVSGQSYAILKGNKLSDNEQMISLGKVKLLLTEKYENIKLKQSPLTDTEGLLSDGYEFYIKNTGDSPANFNVRLVNKVPSDYTGQILPAKYIKVGLEINGTEYGPMNLEEVNNIIDSDVIYKTEVINYNLRLWLDQEKEDELLNMKDYKAFLSIEVEATQRTESMDQGIETKVFTYTGSPEPYYVSRDGWYYIELEGASGGSPEGKNRNGKGALTTGYTYLNAGEKLYVYVGGKGTACNAEGDKTCGGWNGGGLGSYGETYVGYGGGGATDIRLIKGEPSEPQSLVSRIMVAGGGGGGITRYSLSGGNAGFFGDSGMYYGEQGVTTRYPDAKSIGAQSYTPGKTGKFSSTTNAVGTDGSFGVGGNGGYYSSSGNKTDGGSGGGGGWYGGGGGQGRISAGAGGSSMISGYAGTNSVENNTTITHTAQTMHYSGKYFINPIIKHGYNNNGDGKATIKYYSKKKPPRMENEVLKEVRYIKNCINGNSSNDGNHIIEMQAIKDGINIAKGKTGSWSQGAEDSTYPITKALDGILDTASYAKGTSGTEDCLTIDLGSKYELDEIAVFHWNGSTTNGTRGGRIYYNNTYVSSDGTTWKDAIVDEINIAKNKGFRYNAYSKVYNGYIYQGTFLRAWYDGYANTGNGVDYDSTTWNDLTERSYNGTVNNGTWNKYFLSLNGTSSWVDMYNTTVTKPTMEAVVQGTTNTSNAGYIIGNMNSGGYSLYLGTTGYYRSAAHINGAFQYSPTTYKNDSNKVYSLSGSYDSHYLKMYVNGKDASNQTDWNTTVQMPTNSTHLVLGADPDGTTVTGGYFQGKIYSVRFYNKALTKEEVLHNYKVDQERFALYD